MVVNKLWHPKTKQGNNTIKNKQTISSKKINQRELTAVNQNKQLYSKVKSNASNFQNMACRPNVILSRAVFLQT